MKSKTLAIPTYGTAWYTISLTSTGVTPPAQRRAKHDAVLAQGLTGNHRRELDHQSGPGVQIAVPEHFVEGEVVEDLDELGVGHRQGGDVAGKQLVVVLVRRVSNSNGAFGAVLLLLIAH